MTSEQEHFVELIRIVVRAELSQWRNPTDEELQELWEKRIKVAVERLDRELGDDGK